MEGIQSHPVGHKRTEIPAKNLFSSINKRFFWNKHFDKHLNRIRDKNSYCIVFVYGIVSNRFFAFGFSVLVFRGVLSGNTS